MPWMLKPERTLDSLQSSRSCHLESNGDESGSILPIRHLPNTDSEQVYMSILEEGKKPFILGHTIRFVWNGIYHPFFTSARQYLYFSHQHCVLKGSTRYTVP